MNNNNNSTGLSETSSETLDRSHLLDISSKMIKEILRRIKGKRFRPTEGDAVKLQYLRVLISAIQAHNTILKDSELEEIKKRLDSLEAIKTSEMFLNDTGNDQEAINPA